MHFCNWCDKIRELKRRRKNTKNKYGQTCWGNGSTNELIFSMVSLVFSFIVSFIHGLILILFVRYFEPVHYSNYISFARLISIRKTHGDDVCAMSIFIQFFVFFFSFVHRVFWNRCEEFFGYIFLHFVAILLRMWVQLVLFKISHGRVNEFE